MAKQTGRTKNKKNIENKVKPVDKAKKKKENRNKPREKRTVKELRTHITHKGDTLSSLQARFIDLYIELGNQRQAVIQAGYKCKNPDWQANCLLRTPKIMDEINYRMEQAHKSSIAKSEEILEYFTKVMRGEIADQFGLEAPLGERTKAANELAKRLIDIPNKIEANLNKTQQGQATVTISLDWSGMEEIGKDEEGSEEK